MKIELAAMGEKLSFYNDRLNLLKDNEKKYDELKNSFGSIFEANSQLQDQLEDANNELHKRDELVKQWQFVINSIEKKVNDLTIENKSIKQI